MHPMALQAGMRLGQFLAMSSKLWMDMLAGLRMIAYPLAAAVDRGVDKAIDTIWLVALLFASMFVTIASLFALIKVWEIRRRA